MEWRDANGKMVMHQNGLRGHTAPVLCVAWSQDGEVLASTSEDKAVRLWRRAGEKSTNFADWVVAKTLHINDVINCIHWYPGSDERRAFAMGTASGSIQVWKEDADRNWVKVSAWHHRGVKPQSVTSVQWNPNGRSLVTGSTDNTVIVWRLDSPTLGSKVEEREIVAKDHSGAHNSVRWSRIGGGFICSSLGNIATIYAKPPAEQSVKHWALPIGHTKGILSVDWNHVTGQFVTASEDGTLRIWENPAPPSYQQNWVPGGDSGNGGSGGGAPLKRSHSPTSRKRRRTGD